FGGYPGTLNNDGGLALGLAFLSDIQVFMFMEAAQGDRRSNAMQAPKITVFNGQLATITVGDEIWFLRNITPVPTQSGTGFVPLPTPEPSTTPLAVTRGVWAARRFVRLNLMRTLRTLVPSPPPLLPTRVTVPHSFSDNIPPPQAQTLQLFVQQPP